ncbi:3-hydroxybutyryl-CoA dehydrogenase [Paenibacillus tianmuensis]|uniref:3-hydroxybutyryl-CoA dehydrogenase n=1 Tax=Paenibacillus tianmuensis TaxID=624147 RepID=A0A1G4R1G5_9BACL|nr:3-hydroxyacyl-CoA dehydrogenase family protein [Paenibacillus tianmuensis]SCW50049.1 3-hydroxybutyryl-CoA dehydrogenase [Paenibacillus tianmuensis]
MRILGVIGAGVIGTGVAQNFAEYGFPVVLVDICEERLAQSRAEMAKHLRFQALYKKSDQIRKPDEVIGRITFTTDYQLLQDVDWVVENVTENFEIKKEVYKKLDAICKPDCMFLVNTSCISITKIASLTKRPSQIMGAHFMNPVPMKTFVECIRGHHTSDETIRAARELLTSIGKDGVVVSDYPGFVSNRISHLFMNEAAFVVQDQVANPQEVDEIFKHCFSHKMGPLETADLIGIDTVVHSLDVLYESYQDPKFRCCPLLRKMVDANLLGRKTGQGFYNYQYELV